MKRKHSRSIIVVLLGICALLFVALTLFVRTMLSPIDPQSKVSKTVVVPKGSGTLRIGTILQEKGLVRHPLVFRIVVWKENLSSNIQAGTYTLSPGMSVLELAKAMTKGTADVWVTVPEGWRNEEIAEEFAQLLSQTFSQEEFLRLAKDKQGYLFPDTYLVPKEASASTLVRLMNQTYEKKMTNEMREELRKRNITEKDAITLASLIQREAKKTKDMNMVSGILYNRVELGWPLQIDATLQYIKGYDAQNKTWWGVPYAKDKEIGSPYNTYQNPGIPPGPIANPGIEAIRASVYPEENEYLFYLTDNDGMMRYAKTAEEHTANVSKYLR